VGGRSDTRRHDQPCAHQIKPTRRRSAGRLNGHGEPSADPNFQNDNPGRLGPQLVVTGYLAFPTPAFPTGGGVVIGEPCGYGAGDSFDNRPYGEYQLGCHLKSSSISAMAPRDQSESAVDKMLASLTSDRAIYVMRFVSSSSYGGTWSNHIDECNVWFKGSRLVKAANYSEENCGKLTASLR